jgi:uncharacterized membrane protein YagU involved in acid resistance
MDSQSREQPRAGVGRTLAGGVVVGAVAAMAMAAFAMIDSATGKDAGFWTPLYHIAAPWIGGDEMKTSMDRAMNGEQFFTFGPAAAGLATHLAVGAVFGALFGLLARPLGLHGAVALPAGIAYGLAVMVVMGFVGLPIVAEVIGGGEPVSDMAMMVGWGTFAIEHSIYGVVLGLWPLARAQDVAARPLARERARHEPMHAAR